MPDLILEPPFDPERRRRIIGAIGDCARFIEREEKRDADLRPPEVAKLLASYKDHKARLEEAIRKDGELQLTAVDGSARSLPRPRN